MMLLSSPLSKIVALIKKSIKKGGEESRMININLKGMSMKKKITTNLGYSVAVMASFVILGLGSVLAATGEATNDTTGANSENEASIEVENKVKIENKNHTDVDNKAKAEANTGSNDALSNTGNGEIDTGDIDVALNIANILGIDDEYLAGLGFDEWDIEVGNSHTGYNSKNEAEAEIENELKVKNKNHTDIDNKVCLKLNTGYNRANSNTGNGSVETGDISFSGDWENEVSNSWGIGGGIDLPTGGDISASNSNTGANSENEAEVEIKNKVEVENKNHTDIDNNLYLNANTGKNTANYNTGNGTVETGDITGEVNFSNTVQ